MLRRKSNRHDVAAIMGEVLSTQVKAIKVDLSMQPNLPPQLKRTFTWYDTHGLLGNSITLRAIRGRKPRSLRAFFEELNTK